MLGDKDPPQTAATVILWVPWSYRKPQKKPLLASKAIAPIKRTTYAPKMAGGMAPIKTGREGPSN